MARLHREVIDVCGWKTIAAGEPSQRKSTLAIGCQGRKTNADYLKILEICEMVRHLPDGDNDASKRWLLTQLQQLCVETGCTDYQELMSGLFEQLPGNAAARRENRDAVGMGKLFPHLAERMANQGLWCYAEFMQPWAKEANISTMRQRTNHCARSKHGVRQVGYINEELGYVLEGEVAEGPNGVFRLHCVHREVGAEPATVADGTSAAQERLRALDHVLVTGVDQVLAFSAVTALGQRWRRENATHFAANPPPDGVEAEAVTGAEYREWAKSVRNEEGEAQCRMDNQAYGTAVAALAERHTCTGRYQAVEGVIAVIDRDTNAHAHLGMRGVYATCGIDGVIPGYPPHQGEEEESDEEDSEEEDGEEGGDDDERAVMGGGGCPVDDGEGSGDEEGDDEEVDAIMA
ncbi:hypothetical protein JKP88DRAFT_254001 [Tribonema minus]|uniref:Uncharacterized protein n=1 Tax=Tribonema minus TaxID=303371 RepID=A0A835Z7Y0_9STRA|nr:hypothetical protein JKP88DRAFT_254001 [Tribonema minus]